MHATSLLPALTVGIVMSSASPSIGENAFLDPVITNATPEARELLAYLQGVGPGKILAGQHNAPLRGTSRLSVMHRSTQKYPAVVGHDFGFSFPGYWDGINYRQQLVDEAIRRDAEGFINTIMWHAVVPTHDEPVSFHGFIITEDTENQLTDAQWEELTTPGTHLHERWKSQVDVVAWFLKQLQFANVPVLWRPYHEMNGKWFWWGGRPGDDGYRKLWAMLFDRLVNFHGLRNLIWVFNANEVKEGVDDYALFYPGDDMVDILATDVYSEGYNELNYNQLAALAGNKPIAIGECGSYPSDEILADQPRWTWAMKWGEPGRGDREFYHLDRTITHDRLPWVTVKDPKVHYPILR